jgi:hypothetical protein
MHTPLQQAPRRNVQQSAVSGVNMGASAARPRAECALVVTQEILHAHPCPVELMHAVAQILPTLALNVAHRRVGWPSPSSGTRLASTLMASRLKRATIRLA